MFVKELLVTLVLLAGLSACDSDPNPDLLLPEARYIEFGERIEIGGAVYADGLAGIYFRRTMTLERDGKVAVLVESDLSEEEGRASGTWRIVRNELELRFQSSATTFYKEGQVISQPFQLVDDQYSISFEVDGKTHQFTGPGLIFVRDMPDQSDIDQDGNRSELVVTKSFFQQAALRTNLQ